ncbi:sorting nexin-30 [Lethenteron reissneri]|uniref:sorting nexin-30 n=1 Tax=Lethenteron reissneri TaxID=7753 RepID=UPI002AB5DE6E|nr:sorting nexin-30 [Lethenteron reissneri]
MESTASLGRVSHPLSDDSPLLEEDDDDDMKEHGATGKDETHMCERSPMQPPSPASLLNRLQLGEETESEPTDLFVRVDSPEKHVTAMETYITYRVTVRTTRSEYDGMEFVVRRRYQDFDWLRTKLEETQPTHLIPPLPEKFVMKGVVDRFTEDFVTTRQKALDKFLNRLANHPTLSFSSYFHSFLTAKDLALQRRGASLLSRVSESVRLVAGAGGRPKARPPEFTAMSDFVEAFGQKLGTLERIAQRILKEQSEYQAELCEYAPLYASWAVHEEAELSRPLHGVHTCLASCSKALERLMLHSSQEVLPTLREYSLYADTAQAVLRRRDQIQAEFETKVESLASRKEDKEGSAEDVDKLHDRMECADANLKADWERWQRNKRRDLRELLVSHSDRNMRYYQECLSSWESLVPLLQDKPEEEKDQKS